MILIKYTDNSIRQGILLSVLGGELRIATRGAEDILAFYLVKETWISEHGDVVTFEFPTAVFEAIGISPADQEPQLIRDLAPQQRMDMCVN